MNLDIRDQEYWYQRARQKEIERRLDLISAARLAWAKDSDFRDEMQTIKWELKTIEAFFKGEDY